MLVSTSYVPALSKLPCPEQQFWAAQLAHLHQPWLPAPPTSSTKNIQHCVTLPRMDVV